MRDVIRTLNDIVRSVFLAVVVGLALKALIIPEEFGAWLGKIDSTRFKWAECYDYDYRQMDWEL